MKVSVLDCLINRGGDLYCIIVLQTSVAPVIQLVTSKPSDGGTWVRISVSSHELGFFLTKNKNKCPTSGERLIKSLIVHKVRLHGRRGKGKAESFSREKLRQAPQKEGGEILGNLPPVYVCMYVWSSHIAEYGSTG